MGAAALGCSVERAPSDSSTEGALAETPPDPLAPLDTVSIPGPQAGDIVDSAAAIRLGKALFWDVQVGSDGAQACASCHFSAGVDNRVRNTMHPGPNGRFESNGVSGAGQTATFGNIGSDDRVGSQGVTAATFVGISSDPESAVDTCTAAPAPPFGSERQVTARHAPSVVGAAFFRELFWDGRASDVFNGADPFGVTANAGPALTRVEHAALASQAVGPVVHATEMTCAGRPFNGANSLGAKLLARAALQHQHVATDDGVLGSLSAFPAKGLRCGDALCNYRDLIAAAFGSELAQGAEEQFSRIWGQALQAYEATLIPSRTPLDRYLAGDGAALTDRQKQGLALFTGKAGCSHCHARAELSDATMSFATSHGLVNEDGGDQGFHHIGVRPVAFRNPEDLGRASVGPKGATFSVSRANVDRGAFKTPQLRNVKLTAPYFHNGGKATLSEVVAFYARGGDFSNPSKRVHAITFFAGEAESLVDFLSEGLTDCRTEKERAPFDHPSLDIPNGPSLPAVGASGSGSCP